MAVNRVVFVGLDDVADGFPGGIDVLRYDLTVTAGRILPEALRGVTRDEVVFVVVDDGTEVCESTIKNLMRVNCTVVVVARAGVTRFETVTLPADSTGMSVAGHLGIPAAPVEAAAPAVEAAPPAPAPAPMPQPAPTPEPAPAPAPAPVAAPAPVGQAPWDQPVTTPTPQPAPAPAPVQQPVAEAPSVPPWEQPTTAPAAPPWDQPTTAPAPVPHQPVPGGEPPWGNPEPAPQAPPWADQGTPQPVFAPEPGPTFEPAPYQVDQTAQPYEQYPVAPEPVYDQTPQPGWDQQTPTGPGPVFEPEYVTEPGSVPPHVPAPWETQPAEGAGQYEQYPVAPDAPQPGYGPEPGPSFEPAPVPYPHDQGAPPPWAGQDQYQQTPAVPFQPEPGPTFEPAPYQGDQTAQPYEQYPVAPEPVYDQTPQPGWDQQAPTGPPPVPADAPPWAGQDQYQQTPAVPFQPDPGSQYPAEGGYQQPDPGFAPNPGYPPVPEYETYDPAPAAPAGPHMFQPATPQPGQGPWEDQPAGPRPRWMGGEQAPDDGLPGWAGGTTAPKVGPVGPGSTAPWQAQPNDPGPQEGFGGREQPSPSRVSTPTPSRGEADAPGKTLAVLAPKGGVGKTGVTVWVTQAIGQALKQMGRTVGVIDANVGQGDVSKLLGMFRNTPDLAHLAHGRPVTETELDRVIQHVEWLNADCLFAPAEPMTVTTDAAVNALSSSLRLMRRRHSWTVIDCPVATSHDAIIRNFVAQEADLILMLVAPDGPTLDDAEVLMLELCAPSIEGGMAYPIDRVAVVLNRSDPAKTGIDLGMVESRFSSWRVLGEIPEIDHVKQDRNKGVNRVPDEAAHILAEIVSTVTDVSVEVPRFKMGRSSGRRSKPQASKGFLSRFKK